MTFSIFHNGRKGILRSVQSTQAIARFSMKGRITWANQNFLDLTEYSWRDLSGCHHRELVTENEADSASYVNFWEDLRAGKAVTGEYVCVSRSGKNIWVHASYLPQTDLFGRLRDVLVIASDITATRAIANDQQSRLKALDRSQGIVEFSLDGTVLSANDNFLQLMGYTMAEVIGQPHAIFVDSVFAASDEYRAFWSALRNGQFQSAEFPRRDKEGNVVWIQATYNPVLNSEGAVERIVKFATDITAIKTAVGDAKSQLQAISASQAVIEFDPCGTILTANDNFLGLMGYELPEIAGRHHRIFVAAEDVQSPEYETFWQRLAEGEYQSSEFRRVTKDGSEVWIQAIYNPIRDHTGDVTKIVKFATDITTAKRRNARNAAQVEAINRSQAVIEFELDGTIKWANDNFLDLMGYTLDEVTGQHHRIFVDPAEAGSAEYRAFWETLRGGTHLTDEFRRLTKDQDEVWIQATYNPVMDPSGNVIGVAKIATDITEQCKQDAMSRGKITAVEKSQAVIEFDLEGRILNANDNFLNAMGYAAEEVIGEHHSMFVHADEKRGAEYRKFWHDLGQGAFKTGQFRRIGRDGQDVWIEGTYTAILDPSGRPFRVFKFAREITEEVAQRKRVQLLSLVTDETDNSVIITDDSGVIEFVNRGFESMTGYTFDEVKGRKPGELLQGPGTCPKTRARISSKIRSGEGFYEEILNYTRSGEPYWISLAVNPIRNTLGQVERFVSIQSNINKTKQDSLEYTRRLEAIGATCCFAEWSDNGELLGRNDYLSAACPEGGPDVGLDALLEPGERACLALGETLQRQINWPRPGQSPLVLSAVFNSVPDQAGNISKLMMFGIDVTVRDQIFQRAISLVRSSSHRIGSIVGTLESISSETRNLSLNATVEASRSGEAGKGFAVVAGEVRALADKSRSSVQDIRNLLNTNMTELSQVEETLDDLNAGRNSNRVETEEPEATAEEPTEDLSTATDTILEENLDAAFIAQANETGPNETSHYG